MSVEHRKTAPSAFGSPMVNNAGYALIGAAEELTDEQILHQINTNLIGSIQVVRAALPHLRTQGGGRIIQVSTLSRGAQNQPVMGA